MTLGYSPFPGHVFAHHMDAGPLPPCAFLSTSLQTPPTCCHPLAPSLITLSPSTSVFPLNAVSLSWYKIQSDLCHQLCALPSSLRDRRPLDEDIVFFTEPAYSRGLRDVSEIVLIRTEESGPPPLIVYWGVGGALCPNPFALSPAGHAWRAAPEDALNHHLSCGLMGSAGLVLSNLARFLFRISLSLWLKTSGGKWALPERAQPQPTPPPPAPEILSPSAHLRLFAVETACGAAPRELVGEHSSRWSPRPVSHSDPEERAGNLGRSSPGRTRSAVNCWLLGREG